MKNPNFQFLTFLFLLLILVFFIHLFILEKNNVPPLQNNIILSYTINFALAIVILLMVNKTLNKNSSYTGFIFMAGSALKFLVFFLLFYPSYKKDGTIQILEFTAFFIPYSICLITEVIFLTKQLNKQ